jgi:hypothetical protein
MRVILPLTDEAGEPLWVNPIHVRSVMTTPIPRRANGAEITFGDGTKVKVRDDAEHVARQIDVWMSFCYGGGIDR